HHPRHALADARGGDLLQLLVRVCTGRRKTVRANPVHLQGEATRIGPTAFNLPKCREREQILPEPATTTLNPARTAGSDNETLSILNPRPAVADARDRLE